MFETAGFPILFLASLMSLPRCRARRDAGQTLRAGTYTVPGTLEMRPTTLQMPTGPVPATNSVADAQGPAIWSLHSHNPGSRPETCKLKPGTWNFTAHPVVADLKPAT